MSRRKRVASTLAEKLHGVSILQQCTHNRFLSFSCAKIVDVKSMQTTAIEGPCHHQCLPRFWKRYVDDTCTALLVRSFLNISIETSLSGIIEYPKATVFRCQWSLQSSLRVENPLKQCKKYTQRTCITYIFL